MPRDELLGRLEAARPRLLDLAAAPRGSRRSEAPSRGAGSATRCTATISTISRSSSRGPTSSGSARSTATRSCADPRPLGPGRVRGPGRGHRGRLRPADPAAPARGLDDAGRHARLGPHRSRHAPRRLGRGGRPGGRGVRAAGLLAVRPGRRDRRLERPDGRPLARDGHRADARPLRPDAGRAARGRRSPVHGRPALARRLELGLRLPPRPRPQAPRDARPVEREPALDGRYAADADRADDALAEPVDRGDRRGRRPARVPAPPARPVGRLYRRGRRRTPAVHGLVARRLSDPADRLGQARVRPAMVTRRPPARVRPRRGDLGRRGRRVAPDAGRRPTGPRSRAALVARRPPDRLPVATSRLDPGLADRRAGAPPGSAGERAASAASRPS